MSFSRGEGSGPRRQPGAVPGGRAGGGFDDSDRDSGDTRRRPPVGLARPAAAPALNGMAAAVVPRPVRELLSQRGLGGGAAGSAGPLSVPDDPAAVEGIRAALLTYGPAPGGKKMMQWEEEAAEAAINSGVYTVWRSSTGQDCSR